MYAFLSHGSACEALRSLDGPRQTWPSEARGLPLSGACISNQRTFKELAKEADFVALGVTSRPVDLLVPTQAMRSRGKDAQFHVWSGLVPASSMLRLTEDVILSGPELVIAQYCGAQAKFGALLDRHVQALRAEEDAIGMMGIDAPAVIDDPLARDSIERLVAATVLACEFAGTYRLGGDGTRYHASALMSRASLGVVLSQLQGTTNRTRAAEVAGLFFEGSASPMEPALTLFLALPVNFGGMGLPRPELNAPVDVSRWRGVLAERDEVRPDMLWRSACVAAEYDSVEFHEQRGARQLEEDARRSNILTTCGYRVLRVTPGVVRSLYDAELFARQLARLLDVELEVPSEVQALRRRRLFALLMPQKRDFA